jgi:hypothetical protein
MNNSEIREVLLVEAHRILHEETKRVVQKIGKPIPKEARPGYLTDEDIATLKKIGITQLNHPVVQKSMRAGAERTKVLSYPPKEVLSSAELDALENLKLSAAERCAVERLVAEACSATLFHFFCLMDGAADPEVMKVEQWLGAEFAHPSDGRAELHDEFFEKYWVYDKLSAV